MVDEVEHLSDHLSIASTASGRVRGRIVAAFAIPDRGQAPVHIDPGPPLRWKPHRPVSLGLAASGIPKYPARIRQWRLAGFLPDSYRVSVAPALQAAYPKRSVVVALAILDSCTPLCTRTLRAPILPVRERHSRTAAARSGRGARSAPQNAHDRNSTPLALNSRKCAKLDESVTTRLAIIASSFSESLCLVKSCPGPYTSMLWSSALRCAAASRPRSARNECSTGPSVR